MRLLLALTLALTLVTVPTYANAQTEDIDEGTLEKQIIELDKQGWEAWKNNDSNWFIENTTESFQSISSDGISNKIDVVTSTPTGCHVASYSLTDFNFTKLDENAVLLTYTATQDAVCGGEKAPSSLTVAVNYVKRDGKWLEAMYMQAP
jgi:hypothetical protein